MSMPISARVVLLLAAILCCGSSLAQVAPDEHYLIVTDESLATAFDELRDFRQQQGYQAELVTMQHILSSTEPGEDDAATVRSYLAGRHQSGELDLVLLGGDSGFVPPRLCWHDSGYEDPVQYASDLYFACLEGDWNADGDSLYAEPEDEPDLTPELALGRAPVSSIGEASAFVAKVLAFEVDADSRRSRALLAAKVFLPHGWQPGQEVVLDFSDYCEPLVPLLAALPSAVQSTRLYQNHTAYEGSEYLTAAGLLAALQAGDHGLAEIACVADATAIDCGDALIQSDDLTALTNGNDGAMVVALYGGAAAFHQEEDGLLEAAVASEQGGFVGAIGATAVPYIVPINTFRDGYYAHLADAGDPRVGLAWQAGQLHLNEQGSVVYGFIQQTITLLGDPALALWGDVVVSIEDEEQDTPPAASTLTLDPAHPNPFNPRTTLSFRLDEAADVSLTIFDARGRHVRGLMANRWTAAGGHEVSWNGTDDAGRPLPSGAYLVQLRAGRQVRSGRMVLAK